MLIFFFLSWMSIIDDRELELMAGVYSRVKIIRRIRIFERIIFDIFVQYVVQYRLLFVYRISCWKV